MTKLKIERKSFSSPDQLQRMAMMVMNRWGEVWPMVSDRHHHEQQMRKAQIKMALQQSLPRPI
jgi:hypothetical protein